MTYTVYILKLRDGTLYTGYTCDLSRRLREHQSNSGGSRYVRGRRPFKVVHTEEANSISEAMRRERAIKKLPRYKKEKLIEPIELTKGDYRVGYEEIK